MPKDEFVLSPQEKRAFEPLAKWLAPEKIAGVKEVIINQPGEVGREFYDGRWEFTSAPELTSDLLLEILRMMAERNNETYDMSNPIVSLRLPGGHRAQVVAGKQNAMQFSMAIRVAQERSFTVEDFNFPPEQQAALLDAIKTQKTILVSGGTGSGKTSLMNALIKFIPDDERLLTIEDVRELHVPHKNWVAFTFANAGAGKGPNVNDLLNATLRMRPDRILLGEVRKENAFTFCSAINTGHKGSMATVHANDPKSALDAVINRVLLNGDTSESAVAVLRRQLISDIYAVAQVDRVKGGVRGYFTVLQKPQEAGQ